MLFRYDDDMNVCVLCLQDVLLLYYSGWCGFCTVLNHVFLRLARLFQGNGDVTVARCDLFLLFCLVFIYAVC